MEPLEQEILSQWIASASVEFNQIPDIDLYMDQVLTFLDEKLKHYKRRDDEKLLTKTMINNYSKDKVLPPPVNKKYSKKHLLLLIFVYHLKSTLSINDITTIFRLIENDPETDVAALYRAFTVLQNFHAAAAGGVLEKTKQVVAELNPSTETETRVLMILSLILEANTKIALAQRYIDALEI